MKPTKVLLTLGVVAGAAIAFAFAAPAQGQPRDRGDWARQMMVLEGPGLRIGVTARELEPAELERLKIAGGVVLETVTPDGPAGKAGFRAQDVVAEFDGERVRSLRQFTRLVRETPPGRTVKAAVIREGKRSDLAVTPVAGGQLDLGIDPERIRREIEDLTARIPFEYSFEVPWLASRMRLGVTVQELTPELAEYFGAADGVLVSSVVADSPASRSGLKAGDVITSLDGRTIRSAAELTRELRAASSDGQVTLGIVRDKKQSTVSAKLDPPAERRPRPFRQVRPIRTPV